MTDAHPRILDDFPYPVAHTYSLVFDEGGQRQPSDRLAALWFTVYQLLRMVGLSLVSQYLRDEIDEDVRDSVQSLNRHITAIRCPHFDSWIDLVYTMRKHLPRVGIEPIYPGLSEALDLLGGAEERPLDLGGNKRLDPLHAILALRNKTAHGGLPDGDPAQIQYEEYLAAYLPVLHQILEAFDFLGDVLLKVCVDPSEVSAGFQVRTRSLRGNRVPEFVLENLNAVEREAFNESSAILIVPGRDAIPLYPLLHTVSDREPIFLYHGHYSERRSRGEEERELYRVSGDASQREGRAVVRPSQVASGDGGRSAFSFPRRIRPRGASLKVRPILRRSRSMSSGRRNIFRSVTCR